MKERPIIMATEMVKAILEDRKTQTRRVIKPQPIDVITSGKYPTREIGGAQCWCAKYTENPIRGKMVCCRFGQVGDRLWVKERFVLENTHEYHPVPPPTDRPYQSFATTVDDGGYFLIPRYYATEPDVLITDGENEKGELKTIWRPSIHMPRWASRITLEIVSVRAERLQEITYEDYLAEGMTRLVGNWNMVFRNVWNQFVPKYRWEANPWVWVVEFKQIPREVRI